MTGQYSVTDLAPGKGQYNAADLAGAEKSVGGFAKNVVSSAGNLVSNLWQAATHPDDTVANIGNVVEGAANEYIPGYASLKQQLSSNTPDLIKQGTHASGATIEQQNAAADRFKAMLANRYGSLHNVANTLYTDPVGALADLSTLADGAGLVARGVRTAADAASLTRTAEIAGQVSDVSKQVSSASNPVTLAAKPVSAIATRVAPKLRVPTSLDATEQGAVNYGRANDAPLNVGTLTGNRVAQNVQGLVQNALGGQGAAKAQSAALKDWFTQQGGKIAEGVSQGAATDESAGNAVRDTLNDYIKEKAGEASNAYDERLAKIEADPKNAQTVQTGTRQIDTGLVDANNNPIVHTEPITETIALPVDRRAAKMALKPVLDEMQRTMPVTQQQASVGLKALENIVNGPDFAPLSVTDKDLGAVKSIVRGADNPNALNTSQGLAQKGVMQLEKAVQATAQKAGPEAVQALRDGRTATIAKWDAADLLSGLNEEPVKVFNKLTSSGDTNINTLREIGERAPDALPQIGRAYLEGLFQKAFAEAGTDRPGATLTQWKNLGQGTKELLYGSETSKELDNFFTLAKKAAENPNPSGSAYVAQMLPTLGLLAFKPHVGVPIVIGTKVLSKMLFNPKAARALADGLQLPANMSGKSIFTSAKIARFAEQYGAEKENQ
jgi:hypothetical protein